MSQIEGETKVDTAALGDTMIIADRINSGEFKMLQILSGTKELKALVNDIYLFDKANRRKPIRGILGATTGSGGLVYSEDACGVVTLANYFNYKGFTLVAIDTDKIPILVEIDMPSDSGKEEKSGINIVIKKGGHDRTYDVNGTKKHVITRDGRMLIIPYNESKHNLVESLLS